MGWGLLAALDAAARCNSPFLVSLPDVCMCTDTHRDTHTQLFRLLFGKQRLTLCLWKADSRMYLATGYKKQKYFLILCSV